MITAIGACATIAFLLLQWRTTSIREEQSELRTATLETQTAQAKATLGVAQADIAKANAQFAEANARTAAAELRLEELRQKLGPRRIDEKIFLAALEGVPKKIVLVSHVADDPDSYMLANDLLGVLSAAKWEARYVEVTSANVKMCASPFGGVTVMSRSISDEEGAALEKPPDERPKTAWLSLSRALIESLSGHNVFQVTCPFIPDGVLQVAVSPRLVFFPKQ